MANPLTIKMLRNIMRELKTRDEREALKRKAALAAKLAKLDEAIEAGDANVERLERELLGFTPPPLPPNVTPQLPRSPTTIEPITPAQMVRLTPAGRQTEPAVPADGGPYMKIPGGSGPLRLEPMR